MSLFTKRRKILRENIEENKRIVSARFHESNKSLRVHAATLAALKLVEALEND